MPIRKNELNNYRALPLSKGCLIGCLAHASHLAIKDTHNFVPIPEDVIGHFYDLTKKFVDSPKLPETVQQICTDLGMKYISSILNVDTWWNSTWKSAER